MKRLSKGGIWWGGVIRFDPTDSDDPDGTIQSYEWDFNGGEQIASKDPQKPDVVFREAKVYSITLVVMDDKGLRSQNYTETLDLSLQDGDLIFIRTAGYTTPFDIVGHFYTHVGMYIGGQWMMESILVADDRSYGTWGVTETPLSGWSYPSETYATLCRVKTADGDIIRKAVDFVRKKSGQGYDVNLWQKSVHKPNYYCSELIWAAYYYASKGKINLGNKWTGGLWDKTIGVWPDDIRNDYENTQAVGYHQEHRP